MLDPSQMKEIQSKSVSFSFDRGITRIFIAAKPRHGSAEPFSLPCGRGAPIGGYMYDTKSDRYTIYASAALELGGIERSCKMTVEGTGWSCSVPLSDEIIRNMLDEDQKMSLKNFKNKYKESDYNYEFIQMIDANTVPTH